MTCIIYNPPYSIQSRKLISISVSTDVYVRKKQKEQREMQKQRERERERERKIDSVIDSQLDSVIDSQIHSVIDCTCYTTNIQLYTRHTCRPTCKYTVFTYVGLFLYTVSSLVSSNVGDTNDYIGILCKQMQYAQEILNCIG